MVHFSSLLTQNQNLRYFVTTDTAMSAPATKVLRYWYQSSGTDIISLDGLPHNILGKHITLMRDRSAIKRKRKSATAATLPKPFEEV